jgi:hypothetical protein
MTDMWIPNTEQDILTATETSSLQESATFDAKREVSSKNVDIAIDISAMANSAGGVLLYGLAEDETGRPVVVSPFPLKGQPERIDQVVRTSVDEVPDFKLKAIPTSSNHLLGFIAVVVPPSDRAPHMVIVKGERRYYGRGEKGNYILSQVEVARLYERRERPRDAILALLQESISRPPIPEGPAFAYLHVVARPIFRGESIIERALGVGENARQLLNNLVVQAQSSISTGKDYAPTFLAPGNWRREADGYLGKLSYASEGDRRAGASTLELRVRFDGGGSLFCGRAAEIDEYTGVSSKLFFSSIVAGNTTKFIYLLGELYRRASYFGNVEIGVALTGLIGCVPYEGRMMYRQPHHYQGPSQFLKTSSVSADSLFEEPTKVAAPLLMPIIDAIYQESHDPFKAG